MATGRLLMDCDTSALVWAQQHFDNADLNDPRLSKD